MLLTALRPRLGLHITKSALLSFGVCLRASYRSLVCNVYFGIARGGVDFLRRSLSFWCLKPTPKTSSFFLVQSKATSRCMRLLRLMSWQHRLSALSFQLGRYRTHVLKHYDITRQIQHYPIFLQQSQSSRTLHLQDPTLKMTQSEVKTPQMLVVVHY